MVESSISEEEKQQRFIDLVLLAEVFLESYCASRNRQIKLDEHLLYLAVTSAMDDVARYKEYHLEKPSEMKSDAVKRASYMVYWLLRFKPLKTVSDIDNSEQKKDDDTFLVNENFAIWISATYLSSDLEKNIAFSEDKTLDLLYDYLYRDINKDGLILFFQTIKDQVLKNPLRDI